MSGAKVAPPHLYIWGQAPEADLVVGIVGARAARGHAMAKAGELAAELAEGGAQVVSGGAIGIDGAAHRGALEGGGVTLAFLAGGIDQLYPRRNRPLFRDIVEGGGGLLSMHAPGTPPHRGTFIRRNQVLAAMCDVLVVIEAELGSGSLTTAMAAARAGRVVAAVPGSPGCELLLAQGAALVDSASDVVDASRGRPRRPEVDLPEPGSTMAQVLAALDAATPKTGDAVALASGLSFREANRALAGLELEGLALLLPGASYLRSPLARQLMQG